MSMQRSIRRTKLKNQRATRMGGVPTRYNDISLVWKGVQKSKFKGVKQVKNPSLIKKIINRLRTKLAKLSRRQNRAA
jgi:hypothetical protein